ncbi:MAG: 6-carboxytetrahydropterin synthase [Oligoflexia bacterium]|nr:6-carboxytetrahydropterin synthase [Oligoflexia bacterium]
MIVLSRRTHFSSAGRIGNQEFGHNYLLEVSLRGAIDPKSGMVINLTELDKLLKKITEPLDHHYLNEDVEYFKSTPPSPENIAQYIHGELRKILPQGPKLFRTRLYETDDYWADIYET